MTDNIINIFILTDNGMGGFWLFSVFSILLNLLSGGNLNSS